MFRNYLVVSGSAKTRETLGSALRARGYTVTLAGTAGEAMLVVKNTAVDSALVDAALSDTRAETLKRQIESARPECRVLVLTSFAAVKGRKELLRFGEDDFLLRKGDLVDLLKGNNDEASAAELSPLNEKAKSALIEVLDVLVGLLELGDRYFGGSSHQAMRLARAVAEEMGSDTETVEEVGIAALLRDIGKAGIEQSIIAQEGGLSEQQIREIQAHVDGGVRLLEHIDFPWKVLPVIRHHHERYDGRGYPDGLKGREIPIGSRVLTVVDAFLSMVSDRPHRQAMSQEETFEELSRNAGAQFDPEVVERFISMMEKRYPGKGKRDRFRILIADDNEEFRNLLKLRLLNDDYEVEGVNSVPEAMSMLVERGADLILSDVRPGGFDGLQFIRDLREIATLRTVPFILLSSRDDRVLKVRALRLGVDDFVVKTIDLEEMVARVENVLTRETQRREAAPTPKHKGLTGRLENFCFPDIIQTLHIGMKTALVTLGNAKAMGKTWVEDGAVVHAKVDSSEGEEAFFAMLRWEQGDFMIEHGVRGKHKSITSDAMYLLMEGLRLLDEERESERVAPSTKS